MNPEILKMQQDLERFRASKMGTTTPTMNQPTQPVVNESSRAPIQNTEKSKIATDLENYRKAKNFGQLPQKEKKPGIMESMAKGLFSAPATMLARPIQAAAAVANGFQICRVS
jgi:hypothetical protein